jgi:hypothetical protein
MIYDNKLELSTDQAETTQDTHETENDLDLGSSNVGYDAYVQFVIKTSLASSGDATMTFLVQGYDGSSWVTLSSTRAIAYDASILAKGKAINVPVPFGSEGTMDGIERIRGAVTIGGAALTGGAWDAYLVDAAA